MDWIVTFAAGKVGMQTGRLRDAVVDFIKKHLPSKGEKEAIKFRLSQGETLTILDILGMVTTLRRHAQGTGCAIGTTPHPTTEDVPRAAPMLRTQTQPTHEVLLRREATQVQASRCWPRS